MSTSLPEARVGAIDDGIFAFAGNSFKAGGAGGVGVIGEEEEEEDGGDDATGSGGGGGGGSKKSVFGQPAPPSVRVGGLLGRIKR